MRSLSETGFTVSESLNQFQRVSEDKSLMHLLWSCRRCMVTHLRYLLCCVFVCL